jgi:hypothetical protein
MSEEQRRVLTMLSEGKIGVDDAQRLLAALDSGPGQPPAGGAAAVPAPASRRFLRVHIDAQDDHAKIDVRVPLQVLRAGVRLTSLLPSQARARIDQALSEQGIGVDLSQLKPDNIDEFIAALGESTVDIDAAEDGAKVRVFCE